MLNNSQTELAQYQAFITPLILKYNYHNVVLQIPKEMLSMSFQLSALLKDNNKQCSFFVLYDSLKQSCCTDVLGAEHVGYDCLIHFGQACFSSQHKANHHYVFPLPEEKEIKVIKEMLWKEQNLNQMEKHNIGLVLVNQKYYTQVKQQCFTDFKLPGRDIQLMRLPMDAHPHDQYLIFGYHADLDPKQKKNILVITNDDEEEGQNALSYRLSFSLKSLKHLVEQELFTLNFSSLSVEKMCPNTNKLLMQRYSLISQLPTLDRFGLIVSNTATTFNKGTLARCRELLIKNNKKVFTFMMNNLNEVKLGNFPEIEVYVIITCFRHSLFGIKDFHRLVVTPNDLEAAFAHRPFQQYNFDCASPAEHLPIQPTEEKMNEPELHIEKAHSEVTLMGKIQTIDFYRERQFKGLQFEEKKEVKKASKGKIGLAQGYKDLE